MIVNLVKNYLLLILIGAIISYAINQLPPLKKFRASSTLIIAIILELSILSAILIWRKEYPNIYTKYPVSEIVYLVVGALSTNLFQLFLGISRYQIKRINIIQNNSDNKNHKATIKKTKIKGKNNTIYINKNSIFLDDTEISGSDNKFFIDEE